MSISPNTNRTWRIEDLNPQQQEAVTSTEGPVLLLAGAGTGKTRVITCRIAHLIENGVSPENILAVTFTNKAAREMKERIAGMLSVNQAKSVLAATFHSFCLHILRSHITMLGYLSRFDIASDSYQSGVVRAVLSEQGLAGRSGVDMRFYKAMISKAKTELLKPEDTFEDVPNLWPRQFYETYELYQNRMKAMNLVDFDDLLCLVIELWEKFPELLVQHQARFRYISVDEYQDTNHVQFQLMARLAGCDGNICAVGDDDQSIYGWRGADIRNILRFDEAFDNAKVLRLEQNYRSTNIILRAANAVICNNSQRHDKQLWSDNGDGTRIKIIKTDDAEKEAAFAAELFQEMRARDPDLEDTAILYRSNHQSRLLEQAFRQQKIPYTLVGAKSFYERREILDAVSFLKFAMNPKDDLSLLRILNVPPRGIGTKTIERLKKMQRATQLPMGKLLDAPEFLDELPAKTRNAIETFSRCVKHHADSLVSAETGMSGLVASYLTEIGYLDGLARMYKPKSDALNRRENVEEFIGWIYQFERRNGGQSIQGFLDQFMLMSDNDKTREESEECPGVSMMTVHASKGLEFDSVLLVGLEQGLFPHQQALRDNGEEEERRLFYVALTRAKETLYCTYARERILKGKNTLCRSSLFIKELPEELVERISAAEAIKPATDEVASDYIQRMKTMFENK